MLFAIICNDAADSLQLRLDTRTRHLAYLDGYTDKLKFAGPFLDEAGKPNGSMLVFEADSLEEAESFARDDPYAQAGLFADVTIRPWSMTISNLGS